MLNMQKWLISADTEKWNHPVLFARDGYIDWNATSNYEIGDIVYVYCKKPIGKIMYKTFVGMKFNEFDDNLNKFKKNIRLCLIQEVDNDDLYLDNLLVHGLNAAPVKAMRLNEELEKYVEKYFETDYEYDDVKNRFWYVAPGENSDKSEIFKKNNFVGIGWQLGDLSEYDLDEIRFKYKEIYPDDSEKIVGQIVAQIDRIVNQISIGDFIISADNSNNEYIVGRCISDYYYSDEKDDNLYDKYVHCRSVKWLFKINKDIFPSEFKSFNQRKSVFEINNKVKKEFLSLYRFSSFSDEKKRNMIYFGAPGTGKSYCLNAEKNQLISYCTDNYERVTFHPDYTYANFVGTYKPVTDGKDITYKYVPGPFTRILVKALKNPSEPFILIIEEINRANVAAVFGEVFQLLDRENYESQYLINVSEDMKNYLRNELKYHKCYYGNGLGDNFDKIKIPSNMFIWATMNSADQGVFPMDTAFKRRWDFEYLGIDDGEEKIENLKFKLNGKEYSWNRLRRAINKVLVQEYNINEDKLLGPFFAFTKYIDEDIPSIEIPTDNFIDVFKNKIIMYLFEDVARSRRNELFEGVEKNSNLTYSQICNKFEEYGIEIFCDSVRNNL